MKKYNEVEGILYSYYRKKMKIGLLKGALVRLEKRIKEIRKDLSECNININDDLRAITYDEEKITTSSSNISSMEKSLLKAETKLENELQNEINHKYHLKERIRDIQKEIDEIEILFEELAEDELQIIEKKYNGKLPERRIGEDMNLDRSTVTRRKKNIIKYFMELL